MKDYIKIAECFRQENEKAETPEFRTNNLFVRLRHIAEPSEFIEELQKFGITNSVRFQRDEDLKLIRTIPGNKEEFNLFKQIFMLNSLIIKN